MRFGWLLAALAASTLPVAAGARAPATAGLKVERVVVLMRHGVRPPTKDPAMPAGVAAQPWPAWPVPAGWLTPHGAAAVRLVAAADRAGFVAEALVPASGCPRPGSVRLIADSDQRTIATAEAYRDVLAPGCALAVEHRPQGERDPAFSPTADEAPLDPIAARRAVLAAAGPGGIAAAEASVAPLLRRLDAILCGGGGADRCGIAAQPTTLVINADGRPKLAGALDRGSTAAQILLLEEAEGKPRDEVGWGRAGTRDVARLSRLHALEFALLARPLPLARRNLWALAPLIRDALTAEAGPAVVLIAGHDGNVAGLAGLLGVHWRVPGFAADDPSPGGALVLERLVDRAGRRFVRVSYRSQTLAQIRSLSPAPPVRVALRIERCPGGGVDRCPLAQAGALLAPSGRDLPAPAK